MDMNCEMNNTANATESLLFGDLDPYQNARDDDWDSEEDVRPDLDLLRQAMQAGLVPISSTMDEDLMDRSVKEEPCDTYNNLGNVKTDHENDVKEEPPDIMITSATVKKEDEVTIIGESINTCLCGVKGEACDAVNDDLQVTGDLPRDMHARSIPIDIEDCDIPIEHIKGESIDSIETLETSDVKGEYSEPTLSSSLLVEVEKTESIDQTSLLDVASDSVHFQIETANSNDSLKEENFEVSQLSLPLKQEEASLHDNLKEDETPLHGVLKDDKQDIDFPLTEVPDNRDTISIASVSEQDTKLEESVHEYTPYTEQLQNCNRYIDVDTDPDMQEEKVHIIDDEPIVITKIVRSSCSLSKDEEALDCSQLKAKEELPGEDPLEKSLFEQLQDCSNMEVSDETILHNFTANVRPDPNISVESSGTSSIRTYNSDNSGKSLKRTNEALTDQSSVKRVKQDSVCLESNFDDQKLIDLNDSKHSVGMVFSDDKSHVSSKSRGSKCYGRGRGNKRWSMGGHNIHENVNKWGRKKRAWETTENNSLEPKDEEERKWFSAKKKVALLLSYCGAEYHGMQKNPDVDTIEERLLEALAQVRAIRREHKDAYINNVENMMQFQSASRTDKGVSAAQQVVSMKLVAEDDFLDKVNSHLPDNIRVFGLERVTKTFNAKKACFGRVYEYVTPSFAFAPCKSEYSASYRISEEQLQLVNSVLEMYVGTHNFHNFTSGKKHDDKSAIRYITEFKAGKPFVRDDHEFVSLSVSGQSFMIHQIRKMIGLCIAICRGYCQTDFMEQCWGEKKMDVPRAPGLGLLLSELNYSAYNKKFGSDGIHNPLTWQQQKEKLTEFKEKQIWSHIIQEEMTSSPMIDWLKTLAAHTYAECIMGEDNAKDHVVTVSEDLTVNIETGKRSNLVENTSIDIHKGKSAKEALVDNSNDNMKKEDVILINEDR